MTSLTRKKWGDVAHLNIVDSFSLGPINAESLLKDTKHLGFTLSRYKFSAKMLAGKKHILEIGCGEGLGGFFFYNDTKAKFTGIDFDEKQIAYAQSMVQPRLKERCSFLRADLIEGPFRGEPADGIVMLDVVEHLHPDEEERFFINCFANMTADAVAVVGTPNLHAHAHASKRSAQGHINMFDPDRLQVALKRHFKHVFMFSMNDEMVHTGFGKMAHYLMALCAQ